MLRERYFAARDLEEVRDHWVQQYEAAGRVQREGAEDADGVKVGLDDEGNNESQAMEGKQEVAGASAAGTEANKKSKIKQEQAGGSVLTSRYVKHHLLTGSVLAVWGMIESVYAAAAVASGNGKEQNRIYPVRVARATVTTTASTATSALAKPPLLAITDGSDHIQEKKQKQQLIGIWVPTKHIDAVLAHLQAKNKATEELNRQGKE